MRVSQVAITLVLLDEFDAPRHPEPVAFAGDQDSSALEKAQAFLATVPTQLAIASVAPSDPEEVPDADPDD